MLFGANSGANFFPRNDASPTSTFLAGPAQMASDVSFLAQSGQMSFGM
jgi:hypothetical protein